MSCKSITIDICENKRYLLSIIEADGTETPVSYVEYDTELVEITAHLIMASQNGNQIQTEITPNFLIKDAQDSFSFLYCVSYRDPNLSEWILARGFWNDEGIWTNDDIWRDY